MWWGNIFRLDAAKLYISRDYVFYIKYPQSGYQESEETFQNTKAKAKGGQCQCLRSTVAS